MLVTRLCVAGLGRSAGGRTQALSLLCVSQRDNSTATQQDYLNQNAGAKRVAVLGAGVSGLAATKSCLDEGLQPVCFEQNNTIGGTWNFRKDPGENPSAGVYEDLLMNMSKQMTRFSDFPIAESLPTFLNSHQFLRYLNDYADHFRLRGHVRFNTRVQKVSPLSPEDIDGPWRIHYKDSAGKDRADDFSAVIVCTGAYTRPTLPDIEGLKDFKGELVHMANFRTSDFMKGKRVLVIGNQNSAGDVTVLAAKVGKEVTLSVGANGTYVVPRYRHDGMPVDVTTSRVTSMYAPKWLRNRRLKAIANHDLDHTHYGLASAIGPYSGANMITTDHLGPLVKDGVVKITQNVERVDGQSVYYSDGTVGGPYDVIVCATGYVPDFKHVDSKLMQGHSRLDYPIYKGVFPIYSERPTIASIGLTQNYGACPPVFELQARWAARVFADKCRLPDPERRREFWEQRRQMYLGNRGRTKESSWGILDEVSSEFGVRPTFWKILPRSPLLAFRFLFGPVLPTHYRLVGPGAHYDAWEDSLDTYDSIFNPKEQPETGIPALNLNTGTAV